MGVRILVGRRDVDGDSDGAVLYDSVSGDAFGPVWPDEAEAEAFLVWVADMNQGMDARELSPSMFDATVATFRNRMP